MGHRALLPGEDEPSAGERNAIALYCRVKKCHRALLPAEDGPSFGLKKRHLSFDSGV
jgi:hypothetical protein